MYFNCDLRSFFPLFYETRSKYEVEVGKYSQRKSKSFDLKLQKNFKQKLGKNGRKKTHFFRVNLTQL